MKRKVLITAVALGIPVLSKSCFTELSSGYHASFIATELGYVQSTLHLKHTYPMVSGYGHYSRILPLTMIILSESVVTYSLVQHILQKNV